MAAPKELVAGRYRLVRQVGAGGMGVVWEARDERLGRAVAVKQLRLEPDLSEPEAERARRHAMREARVAAQLIHPYAVPVFDVVEHQGRPCLVMQYLPSEPLSRVIAGLGALSPAEAARIGAQVGSALAVAHRLGIVHRDIKPGNILITDDGSAKISDFGIAHALGDTTLTATGLVHGTPAYLAPEVARGAEPALPADVFALGATLYAAVEGGPPFGTDDDSVRLLHRVASGAFAPPRRAGVLTPVLTRMLAVEPADRPTMAEVARLCAALLAPPAAVEPAPATPSEARPTVPVNAGSSATGSSTTGSSATAKLGPRAGPGRARRPRRRSAGRLAGVLAAVAVLLVLGFLIDVLPAPGRPSEPGAAPPPGTTAPAAPASSPTGGPRYRSTGYAVPFETAVPTWVSATPLATGRNLVTWATNDVAVRFLVPVAVHPPGEDRTTGPPRDYLAYLRSHTDAGVRVSDVSSRTVDGQPATLLTATADRPLSGSIGCPDPDLPAPRCYGLRPERRLRIAVVDVAGQNLLIWLRNDQPTEFEEQTEQFEALIDTVRFR